MGLGIIVRQDRRGTVILVSVGLGRFWQGRNGEASSVKLMQGGIR